MNSYRLLVGRWRVGLSAVLLGLGLAACTQVAQARCGDGQCVSGETFESCRTDCALALLSDPVRVNNGPAIRGAADGDGMVVGSVYTDRGQSVLELAFYDAKLRHSSRHAVLRRPLSGKGGLGNPHPLRGPDGSLYLAFRDHQLADDRSPIYTLRVVRSEDSGRSWRYLEDGQGIIDTSEVGLWEPYLYFDGERRLRVVYANERAGKVCSRQGGKKQDIVTRVSNDQGRTWRDEQVVSGDGIFRDGVPAVTRLRDGSYLMVFESWQDGTCGQANPHLLIRSMQSSDGVHWDHRQMVFDPYVTGNRSIATWSSVVLKNDGRAVVSFTSNARNTASSTGAAQRPEAVRSFDIDLLASVGEASSVPVRWDYSSLDTAVPFEPGVRQSNRFTSVTVLSDGRLVVFSGLPNRFFVTSGK